MEAAGAVTISSPDIAVRSASGFLRAHWELFVLPLVVMLAVIPQYSLPIQYNEAMFVVFGREILNGALPYRDVFDQKPPLIYYFYALVQGITGDGFMVTRVMIFASLGVTSMLVTLIAREFYSRRLAFVAGLAFALSAGLVAITDNAGLDQLTLLPLTASVYWVFRWRRERFSRLLVFAGTAVALALLFKPVVLPTAVVLGGVVLGASRRIRPALLLTGTALLVGCATVLALAAMGVLPEAYDAVVVFGREYGAAGWDSVDPLPRVWFWGLALSALLLPATASLVVFGFQGGTRLWSLGGLAVAAFIGAALPGRFYAYYATLAVMPLSLMVPGIFEWMRAQRRGLRLVVLAPATLAFALAAYVAVALPAELDGRLRSQAMGTAIMAAADQGDRIWVRANFPQVYYYAGLRPAHRYFTPQVIGARANAETQIVADIRAAPPRFIVIDDKEDFGALLALLDERYAPFVTEEHLIAYRRRD